MWAVMVFVMIVMDLVQLVTEQAEQRALPARPQGFSLTGLAAMLIVPLAVGQLLIPVFLVQLEDT